MAKRQKQEETDFDMRLRLKSVVSTTRFQEIEDLPISWLAELFEDELLLGKQGKEIKALHGRFTEILHDPGFIISDEMFKFVTDLRFVGALMRCNDLIFRSNRTYFASNLSRLELKPSTFRLLSHDDAVEVWWIITSKALMIKDLLVESYELYLDYEVLTMAYEKYINPLTKSNQKAQE